MIHFFIMAIEILRTNYNLIYFLDQWFSKWSLPPPGGAGKSQVGATEYTEIRGALALIWGSLTIMTHQCTILGTIRHLRNLRFPSASYFPLFMGIGAQFDLGGCNNLPKNAPQNFSRAPRVFYM